MIVVCVVLFILSVAKPSVPFKVIPFSLVNFDGVTKCELHYSAWAYNNYGCYCGYGGGGAPIDGIDECCEKHDKCYDIAKMTGACSYSIQLYFDNYSWTCKNGEAICKGETPCEQALCKCDIEAVRCWRQYEKPLSKKRCLNRSRTATALRRFF